VRFVAQKWRRPVSASTLGPVDTAGIALDDRLVAPGGLLQRVRGQFEWETDARTFWQVFADWRKIENQPITQGSALGDFSFGALERIRTFVQINESFVDFYEDNPVFGAGRVNAAGITLNRIVSPWLSIALKYFYNQGRNTTPELSGNAIPFLPKNAVVLGTTWLPAPRFQLSGVATFRSTRYTDEANSQVLAAGWNAGFRAYWETEDKRFVIGAAAENLLSKAAAGTPQKPFLAVEVIWRQ
jgi:TonB dependent receptor